MLYVNMNLYVRLQTLQNMRTSEAVAIMTFSYCSLLGEKNSLSLLCKLMIISLCISTHFINLIYADFDTLYVSVEIV